MGNCIRKESSKQWGGEDWGSFDSKTRGHSIMDTREEDEIQKSQPSAEAAATEVKIKISKKQLEELMKRENIQGLTAQQILTELMNVSDGFETHHQRSWRPALQSIPELNEASV